MNVNDFSKEYSVRTLIEEDIPSVLSLCKDNTLYYEYYPPLPNTLSIKEDMYALPKNKMMKDKYYVGYFEKNELIGVMDLIKDYPNNETCFIGFFMIKKDKQNKGKGSSIIDELCFYLKTLGYKYLKLAWVKGNPESEHFWLKKDFVNIGETKDQNNNAVIVAIRKL